MVDVSQKSDSGREAVAKGRVMMKPTTLEQIRTTGLEKGDVLAVARVAGIMAAKKTPDLIPLCHPILIDNIAIEFDLSGNDSIGITTTVKSTVKKKNRPTGAKRLMWAAIGPALWRPGISMPMF